MLASPTFTYAKILQSLDYISGIPKNILYVKQKTTVHSIFYTVCLWVWRLSRDFTGYVDFLCFKDSMLGDTIKRHSYGNKPISETTMWYINKLKQCLYRPIQAQRIAGGSNSQISRQLTHEVAKIGNTNYRSPLRSRKYPWYSFLLDAEYASRSIVQLEGLCQWKIPVTPSGIEASTCIAVPQINEQLPSQYFVKRSMFSVPTTAVPFTKSRVLPFKCTYLICVITKTNSDHFLKGHKPVDNCKRDRLCSPWGRA
jgi:hypothetical protein